MSSPNPRKISKAPQTHTLPPLKTQFTQRPRPPTAEEVSTADRTPLRSPKSNKDHKAGFRSMFRSKSDKEIQHILEESKVPSPSSIQISTKSPVTSPTLSENFQSSTITTSSNAGTAIKGKPLGIKSKKGKRESLAPMKPSKSAFSHNTCDPLPLFRAYPQSLKHAKLVSSTLAADIIIRMSNHKRSSSFREDISQSILEEDETEGTKTAIKKGGKNRPKHKRHLSGSLSKAEWTQKNYLLITSGYLLQYAGEGSFDRLPEKMLQLSKDSKVFASDIIAGKHFVLQVSQSIDSSGLPVADSRSLLSRLAFRGTDYRRAATSFLLILESAEEMDSWISVIRGEIESLGGTKRASETGKLDEEQKGLTSPSPRLVPRNPNRFSAAMSPATEQFRDGLANIASRPLSSIRASTDSPSVSTIATSKEDAFLDNPRDNSYKRLSHLSSNPTTISQGSSPTTSPTRDTFLQIEGLHPRPNAMAIVDRRRSLQTMENPSFGEDSDNLMILSRNLQQKSSRPQSSMAHSGLNNLSPSPMYDVSNIAGRHPGGSSRLQKSPKSPCKDTFDNSTWPNGLSTRKRTPPALSLAWPLTPVEDSDLSCSTTHAYTPRVDASHTLQQHSRLDIPRPQSAMATTSALRKQESFSRRFSTVADIEVNTPKQLKPLRSPPTRPPPPPPQNIPLRPQSPTRFINSITNPQPQPNLQTSNSPNTYIRRPVSMQIKTSASPPISLHTHHGAHSLMYLEAANRGLPPKKPLPSLPPSAQVAPTDQTANAHPRTKHVQNRKSMPQLISGPPLLPPPKCALPPLPPGVRV